MRRPWLPLLAACAALLITAAPALACGGLIGSNGAVNLVRTTTSPATTTASSTTSPPSSTGGGGEFGTLIPLPGVPTNVERGGDWTLQRLNRETDPGRRARSPRLGRALTRRRSSRDADRRARHHGPAGRRRRGRPWAKEHGFRLPPDAPEVLDFYANRSPIFLAAVFDADAAAERGQAIGDGTPVHITIPTDNPWVPLRILGLGKRPRDWSRPTSTC